jgi:zinc protease
MLNERFTELERRPGAVLNAGASENRRSIGRDLARTPGSRTAASPRSHAPIEALRVREFGFSGTELDRAKQWMAAFYEHAYTDRDKTESGSFAQEYVSYFLNDEPSPGIAYEYQLVKQLLPGITEADASTMARSLLGDDSRVILATSPQKPGIKIPTETELQAAIATATATRVTPWLDSSATRALMEHAPTAGAVASRRSIDDVGITVVRFANGVEAWLKPTDFKNDQVIFTLNAQGGTSLAPAADYPEASLATALVGTSGVGGLKALDLQKVLTGKSPRPVHIGLSSQGILGSAALAQLETALQLLYQSFTAPGGDASRSRC